MVPLITNGSRVPPASAIPKSARPFVVTRVRSPESVASVVGLPSASSKLTVTTGLASTKLFELSRTLITGAVATAIRERAPAAAVPTERLFGAPARIVTFIGAGAVKVIPLETALKVMP